MRSPRIRSLAAVFFGALVLLLAYLWRPERQIRRHTEELGRALARRNWPALAGLLATEYRDRWGHDKSSALEDLHLAFGQFLFLRIESEIRSSAWEKSIGVVRVHFSVSGSGTPGADLISERVAALREPFSLSWKKPGWQPWHWELVAADQPELQVENIRAFALAPAAGSR